MFAASATFGSMHKPGITASPWWGARAESGMTLAGGELSGGKLQWAVAADLIATASVPLVGGRLALLVSAVLMLVL